MSAQNEQQGPVKNRWTRWYMWILYVWVAGSIVVLTIGIIASASGPADDTPEEKAAVSEATQTANDAGQPKDAGVSSDESGGSACGRLCEPHFWYVTDKDGKRTANNPSVTTVQAELDKGADVNVANEDGVVPLGYATARAWGSYEVVELLLDHGADPNDGGTLLPPIHLVAAGTGTPSNIFGVSDRDLRVMELLLNRGANVEQRKNSNGWTPLMNAANGNDPNSISAARILLEYGANVNAQTNEGRTALHVAVFKYRKNFGQATDMARLLLEQGAYPDVKTKKVDPATPLGLAAMMGNVTAVQLLLEHGADIDVESNNGETACDTMILSFKFKITNITEAEYQKIQPLIC